MKKPANPKLKLTTLGELGYTLPIGRLGSDGSLAKGFSLRPYRMKEERILADYKAKAKGPMTLGEYVTQILSIMVESYGGKAMDAMPEAERRLLFTSAFLADVMYMYTVLRRDAMGEEVRMRLPCGACRQRFDFTADLNTLEVNTVERSADIYWMHTLKHPLMFCGAARPTLRLRPALWSTLLDKHASDSAGMRAAVIAGCVVGAEGIPEGEMPPLHESVLDELSKYDVEKLHASVEENSPGPKMGVEERCEYCKITLFWPIDWGFDHFFSSSSL